MSKRRKATAIILARMGSTRLPGKVLMVLRGETVLWHVVHRMRQCRRIDQVLVATTNLRADDQIEKFCRENRIPVFRGSSDDVLNRYYQTAKAFDAEVIVRITADCPLIDPEIVDRMLDSYNRMIERHERVDYYANVVERTFPKGLDTEILSFRALERAEKEAVADFDREHVTPFIRARSDIFTVKNFSHEIDYSSLRCTLDTPEDYRIISEIYEMYWRDDRPINLQDIVDFFQGENNASFHTILHQMRDAGNQAGSLYR
jgi:spore coat polysaccharide biosynthesis protein SpsF